MVLEYLKDLIPGALLLMLGYFAFQYFKNKDKGVPKNKAGEAIFSLRINAYERMTLFLERISPGNLTLRLHEQATNVSTYQALLLKEIREEYYHNLAQQIYLSPDLWDEIKRAMNEMMVIINQSAADLQPDEPSLKLSKKILEKVMEEENDPVAKPLLMIKKEVQQLFM